MGYYYHPKQGGPRTGAPGMLCPGNEPEIGDKRCFVPVAIQTQTNGGVEDPSAYSAGERVTGVCIYVHPEHRFARYRYPAPKGGCFFECFKF